MEIKIEKGLPLPEDKWAQYGLIAAALKQMEIGDSFECTASQRAAASQAAHRQGVKVVTRKAANGKCRVWRIA
jgi:hypothetical protein